MVNKKVLITGILGQDGSYMAELLAGKGYNVHGIVRQNADEKRIQWLKKLVPYIKIHRIDITNKLSLSSVIQNVLPNEIYNFAGISNVFNAWDNLDEILNINAIVPQHILEIIVKINKSIRFFQSSSCLIYGRDISGFQNENTHPNPSFPYGITKLYINNMIKEFRKTFNIFACSGIFFPHESERRGNNFFTQKVTTAVVNIKVGKQEMLELGNMESMRDWGYAPDFMEAAYSMLQQSEPKDYIIGTGILTSTLTFVKKCFEYVGLNFSDYIKTNCELNRKDDIEILRANINKIKHDIGWKPKTYIDGIIEKMITYNLCKTKNISNIQLLP